MSLINKEQTIKSLKELADQCGIIGGAGVILAINVVEKQEEVEEDDKK